MFPILIRIDEVLFAFSTDVLMEKVSHPIWLGEVPREITNRPLLSARGSSAH